MSERWKVFFVVVFIVLISPDALFGQKKTVVSSDSAYVLIQNSSIVISDDDHTTELPFAILFPMFSKKRTYNTDLTQINLIGKIKKPEDTKQLFINNKNIPFSEEGLFFKVIDISPGKNVLRFRVVPQKGRSIIVNFFIRRIEEP